MTRPLLFVTTLILLACRGPMPEDETCDAICEPYGSLYPGVGECKDGECTPTFGECFSKGDFDTCAAACAAQGSVCAENACAESTSAVIGSLEWCQDREKEGVARPHGCDEAIDWQFTSAARCCCEQSP
jgi:hypothetical protein